MAMQTYAAIMFPSLSQLEQAVKGILAESSYVLASARMPQALLQTRAIGKFHLFQDRDIPNLDSLAQLEFVDVEQEGIVEMYRKSAAGLGYGRISLVSKGGMTYDLSESINLSALLPSQVEGLAGVAENNGKVDREGAIALLKQLWKLQGIVHELSDFRSQNGFSAFENSIYGNMVMACYDFSALIPGRISDISEVFGDISQRAFRLAQLAQAMDMSLIRKEVESALGINKPVYFSPRISPEMAANVI